MCALSTITEDAVIISNKPTTKSRYFRNMVPRGLWQNRLQFQAIAGGAFVCCAGGMKWAWCIFEPPVRLSNNATSERLLHCMWFVGVVVGALAAIVSVQRLQKRITQQRISGFLLLLGGTLFMLLAQHSLALACSCLLEGAAYGLSLLQLLITGGEVAQREVRARLIVSAERFTLSMGILLQLILTQIWYRLVPDNCGPWHANQLHGFCIVCFGLLTILKAGTTSLDSPIQIYRQQGEMAATQALKRLLTGGDEREAAAVAWELTVMRVDQQRLLLNYEDQLRFNLLPFVRVLLLRCYASLSLSLPFTSAYLTLSWSGFNSEMNCSYTLVLSSMIGSLIGAYALDVYGRRRAATCSALLASQLIFMVGGICQQLQEQHLVHANINFTVATVLLLLYQLVTFAGVDAAASTYMAEAFGLRAKPVAISCVFICEAILNIVLILFGAYFKENIVSLFFSLGWLSLFIGIFIFTYVPETQSLALGECVKLFRKTRLSF